MNVLSYIRILMRLYALAFVKVNDVNVVGIAKAQNQKK
ncbi:MAG: hypothetical protein ACI90V_009344, partial [Bacillariaceae sp.]